MRADRHSSAFPLTENPPCSGEFGGGAGPGPRSPVARAWGHLKALDARINAGWWGDAIGAACVVGIFVYGFVLLPLWFGG